MQATHLPALRRWFDSPQGKAVTRAEERLVWVTRYALGRPRAPLGVEDPGRGPARPLELGESW